MFVWAMAQDLLFQQSISLTKGLSCNVDNKERVKVSVKRIPEKQYQAISNMRGSGKVVVCRGLLFILSVCLVNFIKKEVVK